MNLQKQCSCYCACSGISKKQKRRTAFFNKRLPPGSFLSLFDWNRQVGLLDDAAVILGAVLRLFPGD